MTNSSNFSAAVQRLNKLYGSKVMSGMRPPENLTVSEWADKKCRLSAESSAEIGQYRVSRTPYLRGWFESSLNTPSAKILP